ncbi:MipA/OmpV family protein [Agaribacter flavus]|uniref:MipA/OmpV family protein n=1 Tax=Agaribacter flavus TaxID=1902781 RepID=A0ABV7FQT1_9ALTE
MCIQHVAFAGEDKLHSSEKSPSTHNNLVDTNKWEIGLAIGAGVRTNPLSDGDNIPLVLLPDIAWYGEKAYFDNGELGYQWLSNASYALESFVEINRERAFFSFWHPENIFLTQSFIQTSLPTGPLNESDDMRLTNSDFLSIDNIATRRWAVDAGFRFHLYTKTGELNLSVLHDISSTYDSFHAEANYRYSLKFNSWQFAFNARLNWKSDGLIDYYYGISSRDANSLDLMYSGESTLNPSISVLVSKSINENWQGLAMVGTEWLGSGITNSPIVSENTINTFFIGAAYRF